MGWVKTMKTMDQSTPIEEWRGAGFLEKEDCYCGIPDFYNLVARKLDIDPDTVNFNCMRICVTKPVQDQIFAFYKEREGATVEAICQLWVLCGPKASLEGDNYYVDVLPGFFMKPGVEE